MLKFEAHAFCWEGDWTPQIGERVIEQAARAGLDFIEIPMLRPETFDARRHRRHLEAAGLACVCSLGLPRDAHMPREPEKAVAFLSGVLDRMEELGARDLTGCTGYSLGVLTGQGPPRRNWTGWSTGCPRSRRTPGRAASASGWRRSTATRRTWSTRWTTRWPW